MPVKHSVVGAFSVIVQPVVEPMDRFTALLQAEGAAGVGGAAGPRDGAGQQHRDHDRGVRGEARRHDQRLPGERGGAAAAGAGHRDHVLPAPAGPGRGRGGDRPREYRVELQTKVKRRFAKISQSLRKPLLG